MKWFYLVTTICGVFVCLFWTAIVIYSLITHRSMAWGALIAIGMFGYLTWIQFKSFLEENSM